MIFGEMVIWVCAKLGEGLFNNDILPPKKVSEYFDNILVAYLIFYQIEVFSSFGKRYFEFFMLRDEIPIGF